MPRRQFQADLQKATDGLSTIVGISNIQPGADDGEFIFTCMADGQPVKISALVTGTFTLSPYRVQSFSRYIRLFAPSICRFEMIS